MEPKPSATFVLTVRNVGKKPVRILKLSSYAAQYGIPPLEIRNDGKIVQYQGVMFEPAPPPDESQYIMLEAGEGEPNTTEVTLTLENWKLTQPFDVEVVFVFKNGKAEGPASFVDINGTRKMKTVDGLWRGEARSKVVSMKMPNMLDKIEVEAAIWDKKDVVSPTKIAPDRTIWTDSRDGKVSVCLSVDKGSHGELAEVSCGQGHCKSATYSIFSADEPIVVRCAVRNNTKEPLLVMRPFAAGQYLGMSILGPNGKVEYKGVRGKPALGPEMFQEVLAEMSVVGTQELRKDDLSGFGDVGLYKVRYEYVSNSSSYAKKPTPKNRWEGTVTSAEVQIIIEKQAKPAGDKE